MNPYKKIGWLDHVVDVVTQEVIQKETPVSQTNMNHMDDGIYMNREAVILHEGMIAANQQEIKVLKDATLNNMVNNVFLKNFDSVDAVSIISGAFDPVARKIYVYLSDCKPVVYRGKLVWCATVFNSASRTNELRFYTLDPATGAVSYKDFLESASSKFTDVPANAGYAKAVAWAVANGVTNGTGANIFSPNNTCTRGQIITFLHRAYVPDARLK